MSSATMQIQQMFIARNLASRLQVMLIYNLDRCDVPSELRLVNGSRGVVNELVSLEVCMRELEEEEVVSATSRDLKISLSRELVEGEAVSAVSWSGCVCILYCVVVIE